MFRGVIPVLQTPFDEDETVSYEVLAKEVEFAIVTGAKAVVFPGFASEWWKLSETEVDRAAETIISASASRLSVILNITAQSTFHAVASVRRFAQMGCGGLMCLPPFIGGATDAETFRHLAYLMDAANLPFLLQWSPTLTGTDSDLTFVDGLKSRFPHFRAVKADFAEPGRAIQRLVERFGHSEISYLIGFAGLGLPDALAQGANGLMGGCGHLKQDIAVFEALESKQPGALLAFSNLERLLRFEMQSIHTSIATHKWLLRDAGVFPAARVRAPGACLSVAQKEELAQIWDGLA